MRRACGLAPGRRGAPRAAVVRPEAGDALGRYPQGAARLVHAQARSPGARGRARCSRRPTARRRTRGDRRRLWRAAGSRPPFGRHRRLAALRGHGLVGRLAPDRRTGSGRAGGAAAATSRRSPSISAVAGEPRRGLRPVRRSLARRGRHRRGVTEAERGTLRLAPATIRPAWRSRSRRRRPTSRCASGSPIAADRQPGSALRLAGRARSLRRPCRRSTHGRLASVR